jgi:hypothetical protein
MVSVDQLDLVMAAVDGLHRAIDAVPQLVGAAGLDIPELLNGCSKRIKPSDVNDRANRVAVAEAIHEGARRSHLQWRLDGGGEGSAA